MGTTVKPEEKGQSLLVGGRAKVTEVVWFT